MSDNTTDLNNLKYALFSNRYTCSESTKNFIDYAMTYCDKIHDAIIIGVINEGEFKRDKIVLGTMLKVLRENGYVFEDKVLGRI